MTLVPLDCWSDSEQKVIREQLDRIVKSGPFLQSRRRQRFLEYIVNETLAGRGVRLKGYNIALEVFDRPATFDPTVDPIVRMEAARLRDRLREYYEANGHSDPVQIELPKGTYTPVIAFREASAHGSWPERSEATPPDRDMDAVQAPGASPIATVDKPPSPSRAWPALSWRTAVPTVALIVLLAAAAAWLTRDLWVRPPGVAAIAVLPFVNLSGDPKQDYFSDGLTEDILTELSRARDLRVLARNTTFQYKGKAVDVPKLGRDLKVRYVLEGSVQRTSERLRVTAQLIDTETGTHVWAARFDRDMADLFRIQDEVVSQIFAKIAGSYGVIESTEARSATRKND